MNSEIYNINCWIYKYSGPETEPPTHMYIPEKQTVSQKFIGVIMKADHEASIFHQLKK